jgi:hypothetical protein
MNPKPRNHLRSAFICILLAPLILAACTQEDAPDEPKPYSVSGKVVDAKGIGIRGVAVTYQDGSVVTSQSGRWRIEGLTSAQVIVPQDSNYVFTPGSTQVDREKDEIIFTASPSRYNKERQIIDWLAAQQLDNGLLESTEGNNVVSLYDQSLAAMAFMLDGQFDRAERIFDFFKERVGAELEAGPGGFSQFRDRLGRPNGNKWMGDNAWLLISLNHYKSMTGSHAYDGLATGISDWLTGLQDTDGGLCAGYAADHSLLNYKVTEGNMDAFDAVKGYTSLHQDLLGFLERSRWDSNDKNLISWPENPPYRFALDNFSWAYCMFPEYPVATLASADRFLTTQTATINGVTVTGYDIDEDQEVIFLEGTGQMALAFALAGMEVEHAFYLDEMDKVFLKSKVHDGAAGFPYASNRGTFYGNTMYWEGADTQIAISPGVWYLFASRQFNPFAEGKSKAVPEEDRFWKQ